MRLNLSVLNIIALLLFNGCMKIAQHIILNLILVIFLSGTVSQTFILILSHASALSLDIDKTNPESKSENKKQKESNEEDESKEEYLSTEQIQLIGISAQIEFLIANFKDQKAHLDQEIFPPEIYNS